jgi:hypothetical protein
MRDTHLRSDIPNSAVPKFRGNYFGGREDTAETNAAKKAFGKTALRQLSTLGDWRPPVWGRGKCLR